MYNISEKEFEYLKRTISNQIKCYNANIPYYKDELWSIGIYTIGKACALYKENSDTKFTTYANTAIMNEFRCFFRNNKKRMRDAYIDAEINEEKNLCTFHEMLSGRDEQKDLELHLDLEQAMKVLTQDERIAIEMYMQGYSQQEISDVMGYSQRSCVSRTLTRAYGKLKKELQYV